MKKSESCAVTGRPPISTNWVDNDKTHGTGAPLMRSTWVARDCRGPNEIDRDDLFSAMLPIELIRFMLSRQVTQRGGGLKRNAMYLDKEGARFGAEVRAGHL